MENTDKSKIQIYREIREIKLKKQQLDKEIEEARILTKRIENYFQFLINKSKANEINDYSNGHFTTRRIVIAAKRKENKGYSIIAYELSTKLYLKLVSNGGVDHNNIGYVDPHSPVIEYEIQDCIEIKMRGPVIYNKNVYFIIDDDSAELKEKKTAILTKRKCTPTDEFINWFRVNEKVKIQAHPSNFFLLRLTGAKILRHRENTNVCQLRIADKEKFNYKPTINDARFCEEKCIGQKFRGRALLEVRVNRNGGTDCFVQTMFGDILSDQEWQELKESRIEKDKHNDCEPYDDYPQEEDFETLIEDYGEDFLYEDFEDEYRFSKIEEQKALMEDDYINEQAVKLELLQSMCWPEKLDINELMDKSAELCATVSFMEIDCIAE